MRKCKQRTALSRYRLYIIIIVDITGSSINFIINNIFVVAVLVAVAIRHSHRLMHSDI